MPRETPSTIIGLVDAGGAGGGSIGGTGRWSLIFHLAGWRHPGSAIEVGKVRCSMPVPEADLRPLMDRVAAYSIVEAEIDGRPAAGEMEVRRLVRIGASDPDLEQLAARLREPIILDPPILGRLEYSRSLGEFEGRAAWCGREIAIELCCASPGDPAVALEAATRLFAEQAEWDRRAREYAVEELLPLKNDAWLGEGEAELSAAEFLSKMTLASISIDESGGFSFWYDGDDLFSGHAILISGDFSEGITAADILG